MLTRRGRFFLACCFIAGVLTHQALVRRAQPVVVAPAQPTPEMGCDCAELCRPILFLGGKPMVPAEVATGDCYCKCPPLSEV